MGRSMRHAGLTRPVGPAPEMDAAVFAQRRRLFLEEIYGGVAVIPSAPELLKSRNTELPYRQSSDLYYLTGFPEPQAVAVISSVPDADPLTLFVRPQSPDHEAWSGARIGLERAAEEYGADRVYPIADLATRLPELLAGAERIHYPIGAVPHVDDLILESIAVARRSRPRSGKGPTALVDLDSRMGRMRLLKDEHELERMRVAGRIAAAGHLAAMERTRPGVGEWEIQAEVERVFRDLGAAAPAYQTIVGAGANATVLHYIANSARLRDTDLLLIDAGAEWGMYCSDITRTIPASGVFTPEQRDLYDVVRAAEEAGIAAAVPGSSFTGVHDAAVRVLVKGMVDLKILVGELDEIIEAGSYKRFYLHGTSHWLGLDVHDAGPYRLDGDWVDLTPGMVLTVEPGIYISEDATDVPAAFRGVGIRIEDDVVITASGNEILTRGVPVDPREIEAIMSGE